MTTIINRRSFTVSAAGLITAGTVASMFAGYQDDDDDKEKPNGPIEAGFTRDYDQPKFKPSWKNKQINRTMAQDFVILAHSDLDMVKKLLDRKPGLLNATIDWGNGDWETAQGGSSHMGRKDIVNYLLSEGARMDIFCATMMGMLDVVKAMLTLQPALVDARGPHTIFDLHTHAQIGGENAKPVLDYLQSVKEKKLKPDSFIKNFQPKPVEKNDK